MMTLIGWIARPRNKMFLGRNLSVDAHSGAEMANHDSSRLANIRNSLVLLSVAVICRAIKLSSWSVSFSAGLWSRLPWKPTLLDKAFYRLLLVQIEVQERLGYFAELLWVLTISESSLEAFQLEEAAGRKRHNAERVRTAMAQGAESPVFSHLSYYCVSEIPNILAIVRYSASNDHDQIMAVAEDMFFDTEEDFARLQTEVEDALLTGVDVAILSHHDPEYFPTIWGYLADDTIV